MLYFDRKQTFPRAQALLLLEDTYYEEETCLSDTTEVSEHAFMKTILI